jgi:hypothetical protein
MSMVSMAIQTTYGGQPGTRKRGQRNREEYVKSVKAVENLEPDCALVYSGYPKDKTLVRKPMQTKSVITLNRDYEASNSVVGDIAVTPLGGSTTTTSLTATVFSSTHAAMMEAIAVKIRAITGIKSCTVDATARTFTIIASGDRTVVASNFVTTLGTNQATYTYTAGSDDTIDGFATNRDTEPNDDGYTYETGDTVLMMVRGNVSAIVGADITTESSLFARFAAGVGTNEHRGVIEVAAGSSPVVAVALPSGIKVQTGATDGNIADIELNLTGA